MHDASVFAHSQLGRNLIYLHCYMVPGPFVLLGDSAYGLTTTLMNRSAMERSFSLLKNKWRRLRYLDMLLLKPIPDVILTACCLYNCIIKCGDVQPEDHCQNDDKGNNDEEEEVDYDYGTAADKQK
ncbi:hypothetical protein GHT06_009088 [Daphnia sinensis]|uniref:DDE Tnp4 domain-containing protein n=1 Tax=Daphnia sinensis TaxID=1820382 RepID=A0AAD5LM86_9CRUS|nr:hypothetical protein GHT06_009088 [Daphnia sinensis]